MAPSHTTPPKDDEDGNEMEGEDARADSSRGSDASGAMRGRLEHLLPDIVKRTFYAGVGAVFSTEEGIRKMASDFHLPKDVANYLIQQAASSKDELFRVVAKELRGFLDSVNLNQELQKLLTSLSFEIKTEIRFIPNDESVGGIKPNIKKQVTVKRSAKDKDRERDKDAGADKDEDDHEGK